MLQTVSTSGNAGWPGPSVNYQPRKWSRNIRNPREEGPRRSSKSEISLLFPEAVVASSDAFGWRDIRVIQLRYSLGEVAVPPSDSHCLVLNLGAPLHLKVHFGKRTFEGRVRAGEVAIIPATSSWLCRAEGSHFRKALLLYLRPLFVRSAVGEFNFSYREIALTPQIGFRNKHIHHMAISLLHELNEANVVGRFYADSLAIGLAIQLVRHYSSLKDVHVGQGGIAPHKLRKAIGLIDNHLANEVEGRVALRVVAKEVGMSYFHFSRTFKQSMGMSPTNYIVERRIERAKKLLQETDLPISEIALRAGFSSQSHFTTSFRRLARATPKAFRAKT
jgi:AraC family transcriptional regulator